MFKRKGQTFTLNLYDVADYFCDMYYNIKFNIPIEVIENYECCGSFYYKPFKKIVINKKETTNMYDLIDTLIHELTHYCLYELGWKHKDEDDDFQNHLDRNLKNIDKIIENCKQLKT